MSFAISERLLLRLERGHRENGTEDLLLEDPHVVRPLEDGRLVVVAAFELAAEVGTVAADQQLGSFALADLDVARDLLELRGRDLGADLGFAVERMALPDGGDPPEAAIHELVVDRFLHECPRRTGADLALVEGVEHEPFDRLVEEVVVLRHHVGEEDVRRLATELGRRGDDVLRGVLHDQPPRHRLAREGDLRDREGATSKRISKIAFTGETVTGRLIMQYAAQNLIPSTTELGGKSPNIFFADVMAQDDDFLDKAIEGLVLYAFNKGEVCTCPSRALIEESIYDEFMDRCLERIAAIRQGHPLDRETQIGAQVSTAQLEKIASYVEIGKSEGAELLIGGERAHLGGELEGGYYYEPTVFKGTNDMRIFQEEIFGPVLAVTTFKTEQEALRIANDTLYGLGAGVWTRDTSKAFRMGRGIKAGRVWTNCYHLYPAAPPSAATRARVSGVRTTR